ncbi:SAF domain-containing protein [Paenibacillus sp. HB172176]|uniref:Flp pilus assembly protein CpaB n=1 Tax=Paenibacillus sp. HB172176 TaxID=2493690 RepID=UPI00143978E7|nr:SAF domain-containing protein [Paenibacillus sp. HB172176]
MNRRRNIWLSFIAAMLSAAIVYGLYQLQRQQIERQMTIEVVVPKRFISAGEHIKASDLALAGLPSNAVLPDMIRDAGEIIGKEAAMPMGSGEPVLSWKFNEYGLQPSALQSTFQIPKDYIRSISNGIRAGDRIRVYISSESGSSGRLFQESVVVASVKSSGNLEIDNMEQSHLMSLAEGNKEEMYASRRDANGNIEYINLNLTEEQWLQIDSLCKGGEAKLVIAYSPESFSIIGEEDQAGSDSGKEGGLN